MPHRKMLGLIHPLALGVFVLSSQGISPETNWNLAIPLNICITFLGTEAEGEDAEEQVLEAILEFKREKAVEEFSSIEVAEALYKLAALRLKRKSLKEALNNIEECIEIYQEFISRWKVESDKKALSGARRLRRRILRAM